MSRFPTTASLDGVTCLILTTSIFMSQDYASRAVYRRACDLRIKRSSIQILTRRENFLCWTEEKIMKTIIIGKEYCFTPKM